MAILRGANLTSRLWQCRFRTGFMRSGEDDNSAQFQSGEDDDSTQFLHTSGAASWAMLRPRF